MEKTLYERCLCVLTAQSTSSFSEHVASFGRSLGFINVAATVVTDHSASLTEFQTITNAPSDFLDDFHDLDKAVRDPVSQHCKHHSYAIVWDQKTYTDAGLGKAWDWQAPFGYRHGIATAIHYRRGKHFMIGFSGDHGLPSDLHEAQRTLRDFQTFAAFAQASAFELCQRPGVTPLRQELLTLKEIDALRWTMDGKNATSVAASMLTSTEVAESRLRSAMQKLDCTSKYEAVIKAIRLGLVQCD